jgi:hypothetical protein
MVKRQVEKVGHRGRVPTIGYTVLVDVYVHAYPAGSAGKIYEDSLSFGAVPSRRDEAWLLHCHNNDGSDACAAPQVSKVNDGTMSREILSRRRPSFACRPNINVPLNVFYGKSSFGAIGFCADLTNILA